MPVLLEPTPPLMSPRARFHPDQAPRQRRQRLSQAIAPHRTPELRSARAVYAMQRKHVLCQVNAHGSNLFHDFPSGYQIELRHFNLGT
jgi:hypothetical protein